MKQKKEDDFLGILEANKGIIYKVSRTYCNNNEDRKDLIQEIIIQIWDSLHKYDPRYKHSTWIYRIALNVAISRLRKVSVPHKKQVPLVDNAILIDESDNIVQEEEIAMLYKVIGELEKLEKALILLHLENKSNKEISTIMDISESNVSTRLYRIKKKIKKRFQQLK